MVELAMNILKYALISGIMLFVVFKIIKPAFSALPFMMKSVGGAPGASAEGQAGDGGQASSTVAPYEQNLQAARQIAQQEPKIVASVIKQWVNKNE